MPIILVQNEVTADNKYDHWEDNEGVQYHFPNQYIGKIKEGESFIYYRGSRRHNNKRGTPEYFGVEKIGKVWIDPNTDLTQLRRKVNWYCEILDYIPFKTPVPAKINGEYFEKIADNLWSVSVRSINPIVFQDILRNASIQVVGDEPIITPQSPILPNIEEVKPIIDQSNLWMPAPPQINKDVSNSSQLHGSSRFSKYAKLYGDQAEGIVYKVLTQRGVYKLRWVAKDKEKPGWDIEYHDTNNLIAIEVKGTSGKRFTSIDITVGEWNAAREKGPHYSLYLVADCLSKNPKIQIIENPYELYLKDKITVDPIVFRLISKI